MATRGEAPARRRRRRTAQIIGTAWYECEECGEEWKLRHSKGGVKTCENSACEKENIQPRDFEPDPWTKGPKECKLFGIFHCSQNCENNWPSAYAWITWDGESSEWQKYKQACKKCKQDVLPRHIRPLLPGRGRRWKERHLSEHCQKCKELGKDCRNYTPVSDSTLGDEEDEDFDDNTSIRSDVTDDLNDEDGRLTPVPFDEKTTDDFLEAKLKKLNMSSTK